MDKIKEYYSKVAKEFGDSKQSTMPDLNIRRMEVEKILEVISSTPKRSEFSILEVGCGNGYLAARIECWGNYTLTCIDFCEDLIKIAKNRPSNSCATFAVADVLGLPYNNNSFDMVISERCLINLKSWEDQQKSLTEIWRVLKRDGRYTMVEAFTDGWENMNEARAEVCLEPIPQKPFNIFIDKRKFLDFIKDKFSMVPCQNNFLSSYFWGTRILYPALISEKVEIISGKKKIVPNNKFDEFFITFPPSGNYASIQLYVLQKRGCKTK